ncbi:MAG TPA: hypothetical protein VFV39_06720 [Limnobacter sp.]|nr:hypothetical protein [Limnobacter sp.]
MTRLLTLGLATLVGLCALPACTEDRIFVQNRTAPSDTSGGGGAPGAGTGGGVNPPPPAAEFTDERMVLQLALDNDEGVNP